MPLGRYAFCDFRKAEPCHETVIGHLQFHGNLETNRARRFLLLIALSYRLLQASAKKSSLHVCNPDLLSAFDARRIDLLINAPASSNVDRFIVALARVVGCEVGVAW